MEDSCAVCAEALKWVAYGPCGHREVCSICVIRLRFICNDSRCCLCKSTSDVIFVTKASGDFTRIVNDFSVFPANPTEGRVGAYWYHEGTQAYFDDKDHYKLMKGMCRLSCGACDNSNERKMGGTKRIPDFLNIELLRSHLFHQHGLFMCSLCLEGRKIFICEQKLYTKAQLTQHVKTGDSVVDGSECERDGFMGHPMCEFCQNPFYGDNELYSHMSTEHYTCHICQRRHPGQHEYFKGYDDLEIHFRQEHFLCEEETCLAKKFVVFATESDIKRHTTVEHGGRISRCRRKAVFQIPASFLYQQSNEGNRLHREHHYLESGSRLSSRSQADVETASAELCNTSLQRQGASYRVKPKHVDSCVNSFEALATSGSEASLTENPGLGLNSSNAPLEKSSFPPLPVAARSHQHKMRSPFKLVGVSTMADHLRQRSQTTVTVLNRSAPSTVNHSSTSSTSTSDQSGAPEDSKLNSCCSSKRKPAAVNEYKPSAESTCQAARASANGDLACDVTGSSKVSGSSKSRSERALKLDKILTENKSLVERIHRDLNFDEKKCSSLEQISAQYYKGSINSEEYLVSVCQLGLSSLVPELARLFPDMKQRQLVETYHFNMKSCDQEVSLSKEEAESKNQRSSRKGKERCGGNGSRSKDAPANIASSILNSLHVEAPEEEANISRKNGNSPGESKSRIPDNDGQSRSNSASLPVLDEKSDNVFQTIGSCSKKNSGTVTEANKHRKKTEIAHKQADKEQKQRPSAIPGPPPDELLHPATDSIGVKLLQKMGWRHGRSIKDSHTDALYDARREARKAFLAFSSGDVNEELGDNEARKGDSENIIESSIKDIELSRRTPVFVLNPKQDLYGLGFDPYKNASEFRERRKSHPSSERGPWHSKGSSLRESLFGLKSGKVAPGFGIGALEELGAEDEDVYATAYDNTYIEEVEEPPESSIDKKRLLIGNEQSTLPGFRVGTSSDYQIERFEAPTIPKDFVPHHKFSGPLETDFKQVDAPPSEVLPPEDNNLKILIEGVASLVARCGKLFEDLSREKNQSNPLFNFLSGGTGHDYYTMKLWEAFQKRSDQLKHQSGQKGHPNVQKMTSESRGKLLGEKPLERSSQDPSTSISSTPVINLQFQLSDTFTKPSSLNDIQEIEKPFKDDPSKQERFEQFLKEKYEGGLRSYSGGFNNMSEAARARERLDFEAAAEAIEKGKKNKESKSSTFNFTEFSPAGGMQFTSGRLEESKDSQAENSLKKMYPRREEFQWRPSPLLCKRFDLTDPYMGKPPPPPRMRSKMDMLIFTSNSVKPTKVEEPLTMRKDPLPELQCEEQETDKSFMKNDNEMEVAVENVERPVDLYKAIFSDDSDDEVEDPNLNRVLNPEKKAEAANTALSRLIAGDFLESLGKELGLEVPPDQPLKPRIPVTQKETATSRTTDDDILEFKNDFAAPSSLVETTQVQGLDSGQEIEDGSAAQKGETTNKRMLGEGGSKGTGAHFSGDESGKHNEEDDANMKFDISPNLDQGFSNSSSSENERIRTRTRRRHHKGDGSSSQDARTREKSRRRRRGGNDSSSEEERNRKRSRHYRHKGRLTDSDSSGDHQDRHSSKSKKRNKGSSREKSGDSKRHSKHHKHRRRDSPSRSHYGSDRDHSDTKRERKKMRD